MDTPKNLYYLKGGVYMGERNRHFTREFKLDAAQLVTEKGMLVGKVARDLDIHPNLLHIWRRKFLAEGDKAFVGKGRVKPEEAEIKKLRKKLEKVKEQRDILKKALAVFSKQMKYEFMEEHRGAYKAKSMCKVLKVSRSGIMHGGHVSRADARKPIRSCWSAYGRFMLKVEGSMEVRGLQQSSMRRVLGAGRTG
jgi:transposase